MTDDLRALDAAATPAPWVRSKDTHGTNLATVWRDEHRHDSTFVVYDNCTNGSRRDREEAERRDAADAALIVALRNAYASGDLITREEAEQRLARYQSALSRIGQVYLNPNLHGMSECFMEAERIAREALAE